MARALTEERVPTKHRRGIKMKRSIPFLDSISIDYTKWASSSPSYRPSLSKYTGAYRILMLGGIKSLMNSIEDGKSYSDIPFGLGFINIDLSSPHQYHVSAEYHDAKGKFQAISLTETSRSNLSRTLTELAEHLGENAKASQVLTTQELGKVYDTLALFVDAKDENGNYKIGEHTFCYKNLFFTFSRAKASQFTSFETRYAVYNLNDPESHGFGGSSAYISHHFIGSNYDEMSQYYREAEIKHWYRLAGGIVRAV